MKCTICDKPIVLMPSAIERAKNSDKPAAYYTRLFTTHPKCAIAKREQETVELIQKKNKEYERTHPNPNCLVPHVLIHNQ